MEHQTCSSMGAYGENTIAHELAHQWWGDLVTCSDFHHIWINEGFATYSEALYWGGKNGEDAYHAHMASKDQNYQGSIYRTDTSNVWSIFNYIVYGKGAWTLHMLRHVIGDEDFFEALAQYRDSFQFSHASTEDFQGVVEAVWGADLDWFFQQWIYGVGKPWYDWWWIAGEPDDLGNTEVTVHINQVQPSSHPVFKMPIDLKFMGDDMDTTIVVWDSLETQQFNLTLNFSPEVLSFDPEVWIHKDAQELVSIDGKPVRPNELRLISAYPNPFNAEVTFTYVVDDEFQGNLTIYNLRGQQILQEPVRHSASGVYQFSWQGLDNQGQALASGVYIASLMSEGQGSFSHKISLIR